MTQLKKIKQSENVAVYVVRARCCIPEAAMIKGMWVRGTNAGDMTKIISTCRVKMKLVRELQAYIGLSIGLIFFEMAKSHDEESLRTKRHRQNAF